MKMPEPDAAVMARQAQIAAALAAIVPDGVIADAAGVSPYGSDGLVMYRQSPLAVVLPRTTEQVSKVLAWCHANGVKVVARGSGTSLSGGALPLADGIERWLGLSAQPRAIAKCSGCRFHAAARSGWLK